MLRSAAKLLVRLLRAVRAWFDRAVAETEEDWFDNLW